MALLAINTATSQTAIALLDDAGQLIAENSWPAANQEAEKLMPAIAELLKSQGLSYEDLKTIFVINGPGSFTGLRVGVTVANTIAYLTGCQLLGMTTFDFLWLNQEPVPHRALLVFAGKSGVYLNQNGKTTNIHIDELSQALQDRGITEVFGDINDEQKNCAKPAVFQENETTFGTVVSKIDFSSLKAQSMILPNYVKKPAITKAKPKF